MGHLNNVVPSKQSSCQIMKTNKNSKPANLGGTRPDRQSFGIGRASVGTATYVP